jgi:uncharacterized membrane protein YfcA
VGGLLGGLLGVGGGFIMVPLQVLWAKMPQRQANASSLVAIIPIALVAVPIYYFRKGTPQVDFHMALFLVIGSVVGAYVGARLLNRIPERQLKLIVAVFLFVLGVKEMVFP